MDDFKTRIVRLKLKQKDVADAISDETSRIYPPDLSRIVSGRSRRTAGDTKIMIKLDRYLSELEKERGIRQ